MSSDASLSDPPANGHTVDMFDSVVPRNYSASVFVPSTAAPAILRARSTSDSLPWDSSEGGGVATYLPAPPSPALQTATPPPRRAGGKKVALQIPPVLGSSVGALNSNSLDSPGAPLLSQGEGSDDPYTANISSSGYIRTDDADLGVRVSSDSAEGGEDEGEGEDDGDVPSYQPPPVSHAHKLGQWMATGICGNDITSSTLYVTGLCVADSGVWAPVCLLMVVVTLYLFRKIYGEAVTALPLNGGAYNVLLNTGPKSTAAVAACLTILSYVATAVVSGSEAIHYLNILWTGLNVTAGTIVLLAAFAFLNLMGITDSARVAFAIFSTHMVTLTLLSVTTIIYLGQHGVGMLRENYYFEFQPVFWRSIVYGFSSAMLGVSGFESSANFVEEQKDGVFVKTLRNMWVAVSIFNPLLAFLALCTMRQDFMAEPDNQPTVLAEMGRITGGEWLQKLVCVDAFLVLSGGVLTSFVGVAGLCRRLALDRCMPQFLLAENSWRRTNHWIILGFFAICSSMYLILSGDVDSLANVYSISFMSVMALFAVGNMLLKYKRGKLRREVQAPWSHVFAAFAMVLFSLTGLLLKDPSILVVWFLYFLVTGGLMATMFFRVQTLKLLYTALRSLCGARAPRCLERIHRTIQGISGQGIGFFAKSGRLSVLNKAILYVRNNEDCAWIRIIHVYESEDKIPPKLLRNVKILDEMYPKLKIDVVLVPGTFSGEVIDYLSHQLQIPKVGHEPSWLGAASCRCVAHVSHSFLSLLSFLLSEPDVHHISEGGLRAQARDARRCATHYALRGGDAVRRRWRCDRCAMTQTGRKKTAAHLVTMRRQRKVAHPGAALEKNGFKSRYDPYISQRSPTSSTLALDRCEAWTVRT